jgi:hypothetical protein
MAASAAVLQMNAVRHAIEAIYANLKVMVSQIDYLERFRCKICASSPDSTKGPVLLG